MVAQFRWSPVRAVVAVLLLAGLAVSSCARPDYHYVEGDTPKGPFLKVPQTWTQFDSRAIASWRNGGQPPPLGSTNTTIPWQVAFDASSSPNLDHVLKVKVTDQPSVLALSETLSVTQAQSLQPSQLTDLVMPVSTLGSTSDPDYLAGTSSPVAQGAAQGLHLVFQFRQDANSPWQTVDQTGMLSGDHSRLYMMVVRCSTTCYQANKAAIDGVVSSWTVKEDRRG